LSSNYRIFETNEYLKCLKKFSKHDHEYILKKTKSYIYPQIKKEPHFGLNIKKLTDYSPPTWRYRLGKFRLFYIIEEKEHIIDIVSIEFRRDSYK
jgi:mRNA interferase RelE/StbE